VTEHSPKGRINTAIAAESHQHTILGGIGIMPGMAAFWRSRSAERPARDSDGPATLVPCGNPANRSRGVNRAPDRRKAIEPFALNGEKDL
jgi:hypothetical protein